MNFYEYDITSDYGERIHPITNKKTFHHGVDYALPLNTEVLSNVSGTVTTSTYDADGYGNYVVVKDGSGKLHYYAHLNKSNVNVGDIINVNDSIGLSGSTGMSTGPHLHYEIEDGHMSVNPSLYLTMGNDVTQTESDNIQTNDTKNIAWWNIKDKLKLAIFNIFKFIIIALLIVLFVVFITKALDISIF